MKKQILSIILAVSVLSMSISGCAPKTYYSSAELPDTDFSEMTCGEEDYVSMFKDTAAEICAKAKQGADEETIRAELEKLNDILDEIQNNYDLTYLHMSIDNSEENILRNKAESDNITAMSKSYNDLIFDLCDLGYKQAAVEFSGEEISDEELDNKPSDRYYELKNRETELTAQYQRKAENAVNSNDTTLGELFYELVRVRNEIAKERGYDNYADYAYTEKYRRDYTVEDAANLHKNIKEIIAPVSAELTKAVAMDTRGEGNRTAEEVIEFLGECAENISPEIKASYDCMVNNHLYDIDYSTNKLPRNAYTKYLSKYNSAFIFSNQPSIGAVIHEFGHFNQMMYCADENAYNNDLAEIHSQGFEILCMEYYDKIYKERADIQRMYRVSMILRTIVQSSMFDEWETEIYKNPDMTLEDYDALFSRLTEEYNMGETYGHAWARMFTHPFITPLYMISYAASGLASMEIWEMSQKNMDKAVDRYMTLTAADMDGGFKAVTEKCGFDDIFSDKALKKIAKQINKQFLN